MSPVPDAELSFSDIFRILNRRRRTLFTTALVVLAISILLCAVMTRRYEATGIVQLQKSNSDSLGLENMVSAGASDVGDPLTVNIDLQTQAETLQSNALALKVIKDLDLEHNHDFNSSSNPIDLLMKLVSPKGNSDSQGASLDDSPARREALLKTFASHLTVKVIPGTRLISIKFSNRDPKVAAAVVNHLIQALIDFSFQTKFTATTQISGFLEGQLADLRNQSQELQRRVVALQKDSGLFGVGSVDATGKPQVYSPIMDRLQQSTTALAQAQMSSVVKGAIYQVVKTGDPEAISQLNGTAVGASAGSGVADSLTLIQNLRMQESQLQSQLDSDSSRYGAAYPKLAEERASIEGIRRALVLEDGRITARARNDYQVALKAEQGARDEADTDRRAAERLNDKTVEYSLATKEASQSEDLYQDLLKRLKEAGILEGLHSSSVTVVDPARVPDKPSRPNIPIILLAGLALGLFAGGCAAILMDVTDDSIQGLDAINTIGLPVIGLVPTLDGEDAENWKCMRGTSYSEYCEAVRRLRATLMVPRAWTVGATGAASQVVLIASGSSDEGKSTLAVSLAMSFAQAGKKVLLVETDFRRPSLNDKLNVTSKSGLSDAIEGGAGVAEPMPLPDFAGIHFVPSGPRPIYPAEALASSNFAALIEQWRTQYDIIVMDCPPVLPLSDTQHLAILADAIVLLARSGFTSKTGLERSYQILLPHVKDPEKPAIGIVLSHVSPKSSVYKGFYGHRKYEFDRE